jgi:hypothetical protein
VKSNHLVVPILFLAAGVCHADVPTPEQECRLRNSAICEFGKGGVQTYMDGPCPAGARTIRPQGREYCDAMSKGGAATVSIDAGLTAKAVAPNSREDLAWAGRMERWLIPLLLLASALLVAGIGIALLFRRRTDQKTGEVSHGTASLVIQLTASGISAALAAYMAGGFAFQRVFSSFNNHDTAAPALIAAPVALLAAMLAWFSTFAVMALLIGRFLKTRSKGPVDNGPKG